MCGSNVVGTNDVILSLVYVMSIYIQVYSEDTMSFTGSICRYGPSEPSNSYVPDIRKGSDIIRFNSQYCKSDF